MPMGYDPIGTHRSAREVKQAWTREPVVMDFSGAYDLEGFGACRWVDCRALRGVNGYCDAEGAAAIRAKIAEEPVEALHFIDSGNYHYVTRFWTEKLDEPFSLVVFDHHPDMQPEAWGSGLLSCGNWLKKELEELPNVRQVLLVGPREKDMEGLPLDPRVTLCPEPMAEQAPDQVERAEAQLKGPVYISLDKDILDPEDAPTNWSQGELLPEQLKTYLDELEERDEILGVDVCGEPSPDLAHPQFFAAEERLNHLLVREFCGLRERTL